MKTVNVTIELENDEQVYFFEQFIRKEVKVKDFQILPDTKELYENNSHFRKLTKAYYDAKKLRNDFINDNNFD